MATASASASMAPTASASGVLAHPAPNAVPYTAFVYRKPNPASAVTAPVDLTITAFGRCILSKVNPADYPLSIDRWQKEESTGVRPNDSVSIFGCSDVVYKEVTLEEIAAPRRKAFLAFAQVFSHYKENAEGILRFKRDPNYTWEKPLTTLQLLSFVEEFFGEEFSSLSADCENGGILTADNDQQFLFKKERGVRHIFQCARVNDDIFQGLEQLGAGTYGAVYKVLNVASGGFEALKVVSPENLTNLDESIAATKWEHHILCELNQTSLAPYIQARPSAHFSFTTLTGRKIYAFSCKLYKGDLNQWLLGNHSTETRLKVCTRLLTILDQMQKCNVKHRDVKPKNFLYDGPEDNPQVFLADFGLTVRSGVGVSPPIVNFGSKYDVRRYESAKKLQDIADRRVELNHPNAAKLQEECNTLVDKFLESDHYAYQDIYSIGVTMFQVLSRGYYPYENQMTVISQPHSRSIFDSNKRLSSIYSRNAIDVVRTATQPVQEKRTSAPLLLAAWNTYMLQHEERRKQREEAEGKQAEAKRLADEASKKKENYSKRQRVDIPPSPSNPNAQRAAAAAHAPADQAAKPDSTESQTTAKKKTAFGPLAGKKRKADE